MRVFNIFTVLLLGIFLVSCKQETIQGDYFGEEFAISDEDSKTSAPYDQIIATDSLQTQMVGEIKEVCQAKGCWMKVKLESNEEVFVRFKDYGFFVPKDEGASEDELALITAPKKTFRFEADGVLIESQP